MGELLDRELRWTEAREWHDKAVAANPKSAQHHAALAASLAGSAANASMLEQMTIGRKALAEYESALELDPTLIDVRAVLAQMYAMAPSLMGGGVEKAEAQVAAIAKLNPMRGHMARGAVLAARRDSAAAEQEYVAAIAVAPDSIAARYRLASFYRARRDWAKAFAVYDSVRRRWPKDELLPYGFGMTAALAGQQLDEAGRELRSWIVRPSPDVTFAQLATAHYSLGLIAEKNGKPAEARAEYEAALRLNPQHKDARQGLQRLK